jgi:hypothetical protein
MRTTNADALDRQGWLDRCKLVAFMLWNLGTFNDDYGGTLRDTLRNHTLYTGAVRRWRNQGECPTELLFKEIGLPLVPQLQDAVEAILEGMENDNKVMYREGLIHLI